MDLYLTWKSLSLFCKLTMILSMMILAVTPWAISFTLVAHPVLKTTLLVITGMLIGINAGTAAHIVIGRNLYRRQQAEAGNS